MVELDVDNKKGENKLGGRVGGRKGNKTRGINRRDSLVTTLREYVDIRSTSSLPS
jgi:hypothetical protein